MSAFQGHISAKIDGTPILIKIINMKKTEWIDRALACARLGVRPQTLYAYVSRGLVRAQSDTQDGRRSLYALDDIETLAKKHSRPRARAEVAKAAIRWGDPVLRTSISRIQDGQLWFGAALSEECAERLTLEDMAAHHCRVDRFEPQSQSGSKASDGLMFFAQAVAQGPAMELLERGAIAQSGADLMSGLCSTFCQECGTGPVHERISRAWGCTQTDVIRRALVLLSDHDLNPSTFAVRVCASTGGSLAAALLAGYATLIGPRHGGVAIRAAQALEAGLSGPEEFEAFLAANQTLNPYAFGFGHPLYPKGDPRAAHLVAQLDPYHPAVEALFQMSKRLGIPVNIDGALAGLVHTLTLPKQAGFEIFALGRLAGWIGHAIEQVEDGEIIRPRAEYHAP